MEEKTLAESRTGSLKFVPLILAFIGFILMLFLPTIDLNAGSEPALLVGILAAVLIIIGLVFYISISKCKMTVTDKRIYGTAGWGKRVDLPLDSVSSVGTSMLGGIAVGTSSGRISFVAMKKRDEIHSMLSKLIVERQNNTNTSSANNSNTMSSAEEIKKYKDLLDSGIITQEEFDTKKKQLLGL